MAYRGTKITLPAGIQGFHGSRNPSALGPGHLSLVEGVDIDGAVLVKDGGAMKINSVALGAPSEILAGWNWTPVPAEFDDIVVLGNGDVLKDTGAGTWATNMGNINPPAVHRPFFVGAGGEATGATRKLFIFSDSDKVQVISGTGNTIADISGPAADWASSFPIFGVQHKFRLWAGGNASDPHRIYYTTTTNHQDFAGGGTLSIFPSEGEGLVAGISFRGLLILFKYPKGVYVVDTRDPTPANWVVDRLNLAVGTVGPWGIVQISNDVLILSPTGDFHLLTAVQDFGDINTSNISRLIDLGTFMRANANLSSLNLAMGAWYAAKSKAWFMVPQAGSALADLRIMVDFNNPQLGARYLLSKRDVGTALWMRPDDDGIEKPTMGDDEGFIWRMDQDERNKDGSAYSMEFETSENDFSYADPELAGTTKNGQFIEVVADLIANTVVNVTPVWDGLPADPVSITIGTAGVALGSFVLGEDALSATGIVTARERITGQGRRLKLIVENSTINDEVRLSEFRVEVGIADERIRQAD